MEQEKEPRTVINVRVRRQSKIAMEEKAASLGLTASDYHRACLAFAQARMPDDFAANFRSRAIPKK